MNINRHPKTTISLSGTFAASLEGCFQLHSAPAPEWHTCKMPQGVRRGAPESSSWRGSMLLLVQYSSSTLRVQFCTVHLQFTGSAGLCIVALRHWLVSFCGGKLPLCWCMRVRQNKPGVWIAVTQLVRMKFCTPLKDSWGSVDTDVTCRADGSV